MFASTEPPAPIAVMRPGSLSPSTGGVSNSCSTIRLLGFLRTHSLGVLSTTFPTARVIPGSGLSSAALALIETTGRELATRIESSRAMALTRFIFLGSVKEISAENHVGEHNDEYNAY